MASNPFSVSLAVIGGGMAGLAAAAMATLHKPRRVVLLEKQTRLGCKVRVSGSGQCNVTHLTENDRRDESIFTRYGERKHFVKPALCHWTPQDTIQFFSERGCRLIVEENGKVFPASRRAADVVGVLEDVCRRGGVEIVCGDPVTAIQCQTASPRFRVVTKSGTVWDADSIVLATGGQSYPQTGSSGDGYRFAAALGHTIIAPRPALAPVIVRDWPFASVAGVSLRSVDGEIWRGQTKVQSFRGDVLFTHRGLSGPAILDVSRFVAASDTVRLNLFTHKESRCANVKCTAAADKELLRLFADAGAKTVRRALAPLSLPDTLVAAIFAQQQIPLETRVASCDVATRRRLAESFAAFDVTVAELGGWNEAMVTAGGVDTREVNPKTMQSRIVPGLFFAGELLDIDGDCGGFNLQWAMASGCLAASKLGNDW